MPGDQRTAAGTPTGSPEGGAGGGPPPSPIPRSTCQNLRPRPQSHCLRLRCLLRNKDLLHVGPWAPSLSKNFCRLWTWMAPLSCHLSSGICYVRDHHQSRFSLASFSKALGTSRGVSHPVYSPGDFQTCSSLLGTCALTCKLSLPSPQTEGPEISHPGFGFSVTRSGTPEPSA